MKVVEPVTPEKSAPRHLPPATLQLIAQVALANELVRANLLGLLDGDERVFDRIVITGAYLVGIDSVEG